jgi:Fe-S cluster assembly protein SufB
MPLQAYFRINQQSMGQFERTLIIAEPGSFVHYVEGCSAPVYQKSSLHSAVVELIALPGAHIRYTTIQNWSQNVYNLVTKRAIAHEGATVEWIDGNFGSKVTMKYPCIILKGRHAKGSIISLAVAGKGQQQDAGGKIIHIGQETTSHIVAKSISKEGGRSSYRGLIKMVKGAHGARAQVQCDALLLDAQSRTDTYPTNKIDEPYAELSHEASVSTVSDEQLFYLQSRGLSEQAASALIVNGFIDGFVDQLPMEYAVEINRLINHEMAGSVG